MTLKMDKAGRVVLPKALRDRLGLHPGADLEISESSEGVLLRPAKPRRNLVWQGHLLVHTGELPAAYDITRAIEQDRDERIRQIWAL